MLFRSNSCLQFDFENCKNEEQGDNIDIQEDFIDMDDEEINQTYQMFEFVTVPSFVSLYSGNLIEPLYFVELTGKGVA